MECYGGRLWRLEWVGLVESFPGHAYSKEDGHFHDVRHVFITVGIGPSIDKGNVIVGRERLGLDGSDFVPCEGRLQEPHKVAGKVDNMHE